MIRTCLQIPDQWHALKILLLFSHLCIVNMLNFLRPKYPGLSNSSLKKQFFGQLETVLPVLFKESKIHSENFYFLKRL
jgi:hypothetical protein